MDRITSRFLIYGGMPDDSVLMQLSHVCRTVRGGEYDLGEVTSIVYAQIKRILEISTDFAFDKNLWQNYLTYLLVTAENPFTLTAEKTGGSDGSVNHFAKNDFAAFIELFHYDFSWLEEILQTDVFSCITNYKAIEKPALMYNGNVSEKVRALSDKLATADDADDFFTIITRFYRDYGVGMFGLNKAFRIAEAPDGSVIFKPVANMEHVVLDDLHGYELQKQKLIDNTEAFVEGRKANNVLLFGDSGTGKSTSIKAIVNEYYDRGLRMIEIYKYQFRNLSQLISQIKNRNYKFIIYMDDLSFEEDESEYKFLKAVIEGGLETKPSNILIYATSNRRHLIMEMWTDRDDMEQNADIHRSDTMEEKLSLANRFGVTIGYYKPDRKLYHDIVRALADRNGIEMEDEQLFLLSDQWEMSHGGVSGRTADQFINHLNGARHH
ncbi:MAG: ATP-binding protein [Lachnospiraceae bacterium]|nr:ATP-binding protein [Lachnospiraceae bacterium]